jgi:hypothetical protein
MSAETLLARLDGVKQTSSGRWIARCPAHADRSPSLSIRELEDGRVLVHDFAGCDVSAVLDAVNLDLADLFATRIADHARPVRPNHSHAAGAALTSLADDALLVGIAAESLASGIALTRKDRDALVAASGRIQRTVELVRR